ncbi:MAG: hypothetical protein J7K73_01400 [Nanoarchaeota archaeon]|nr:hypothetical protein [Nanoarchaeota archaeon]
MHNKRMNYYIAISLIIGTVIGAGIFGIPYAMSQAGLLFGLLNLIFVGTIVTFMTLYMGEVVMRTKKESQFILLAEKYLGKPGKWLMFLSMSAGIYGALTAYLVGIGQSAAHILGGNPIVYSMIFFIFAAPLIYFGLKTVTEIEFGLTSALIAIFIIISLALLPNVKLDNLTYYDTGKALFPYGVILFATLGYSVVPEVSMILKRNGRKLMSAIVTAMLICISIYALFSISMVGTLGTNVAEIATNSLNGIIGELGTVVAILAMATGFLALGIVLKHIYQIDLRINPKISWGLVVFVPLIIFLVFSPSFVTAVALTGTYSGGLAGILCSLMAKEARKKGDLNPKFVVPGGDALIYISIIVFAVGMLLQTMMLLS